MTDLSGIEAAAVGGILALSGVCLNNWWSHRRFLAQLSHENAQKMKEHKLGHAETLYGLIDEWQKVMFSMHMQTNYLMVGQLTYEAYIKKPIDAPREDYRFYRIQMIISAYFPELEKQYSLAMERRKEANKQRSSVEKYCEQKMDKSSLVFRGAKQIYLKAQDDLDAVCDELKKEIIQVIRKL